MHILPQPTEQLSAFSAPFSASIPEEPWLNPFVIGFLSVAPFFGVNLWPRDRVLVSSRLPERNPDPELTVEFSGIESQPFTLIFLFVKDNEHTV